MKVNDIITEAGWKTGASLGGIVGGLTGGVGGAIVGAGVGAGLQKALSKKDKKNPSLDDKIKQQAWNDHIEEWKDYITALQKEAFERLGGWSDHHKPGYEFVSYDDVDNMPLYMNKKLFSMLYTIEAHFQEEIDKILTSKKTQEQKSKDLQRIGELAAAEFQKYKRL